VVFKRVTTSADRPGIDVLLLRNIELGLRKNRASLRTKLVHVIYCRETTYGGFSTFNGFSYADGTPFAVTYVRGGKSVSGALYTVGWEDAQGRHPE